MQTHLARLGGLFAAILLALPGATPAAAELRGHGGPVRAIAVSADGSRALTGSFDATAIVWSLRDEAARQVLQFHDSQVNAVLALEGDRYVTAGQDGRIALWRDGEAAPFRVLTGHEGPVAALALAPGGEVLASASWDRTVRLWPLSGGAPLILSGHQDSVNALAYLADGTLASGGYDMTIRYWAPDGRAIGAITVPSTVNALLAAGVALAAGSADGHVRLLARDGEIVAERKVGPSPVIAMAMSPDGRHLAAAGIAGATLLMEAGSLEPQHNLVGPGLPVWSLAFTPDGATLLTGGSDRMVRNWSVATGEPVGGTLIAAPPDPLAAHAGERGAEVFRACVACHTLEADAPPRAGPTLHGIFGRPIAAVPGYPYSAAFRELDIVWTPETVARLFEVGPHAFTPGTKMPEQVIASAADREALVTFLERVTAER